MAFSICVSLLNHLVVDQLVGIIECIPSTDEGCLRLQVISLTTSFSLVLSRAKVLDAPPTDDAPPLSVAPIEGELVTVVFSQRSAKMLELGVGDVVAISPPW